MPIRALASATREFVGRQSQFDVLERQISGLSGHYLGKVLYKIQSLVYCKQGEGIPRMRPQGQ